MSNLYVEIIGTPQIVQVQQTSPFWLQYTGGQSDFVGDAYPLPTGGTTPLIYDGQTVASASYVADWQSENGTPSDPAPVWVDVINETVGSVLTAAQYNALPYNQQQIFTTDQYTFFDPAGAGPYNLSVTFASVYYRQISGPSTTLSISNTEVPASAFHNDSNGAANPNPVADFKVTLSQTETSAVTVNYTLQSGTAVQGLDYKGYGGSITIPAGQTTGDIVVPLTQNSEPTENFKANITSVSAADGSPITIADATGTATIDQHNKVDVYVIETGNGTGTLYWTLDGILVGSPSLMHYDQSLPIPAGNYSSVFRIGDATTGGAAQGHVIELDNPTTGQSDFVDRQSVQIHVGNYGGNSLGCIVSSQQAGTTWGSLQAFDDQVTNLHLSNGGLFQTFGGNGSHNTISTPTTFETVDSNNQSVLTKVPANNGSIQESFNVQATQWDLPITVHVSGPGSANQPYINLSEQSPSTITAGQPENFTLGISGDPSYGFGDRDVIALVRVTGAAVADGLAVSGGPHGLSAVYDTTNAYGTFYDVTVSKNTNSTNFTLTTDPSFSGVVNVSVVGYQEQLYTPQWVSTSHVFAMAPNHGPMVPDGQVMLDNGVHDAQVHLIGISA